MALTISAIKKHWGKQQSWDFISAVIAGIDVVAFLSFADNSIKKELFSNDSDNWLNELISIWFVIHGLNIGTKVAHFAWNNHKQAGKVQIAADVVTITAFYLIASAGITFYHRKASDITPVINLFLAITSMISAGLAVTSYNLAFNSDIWKAKAPNADSVAYAPRIANIKFATYMAAFSIAFYGLCEGKFAHNNTINSDTYFVTVGLCAAGICLGLSEPFVHIADIQRSEVGKPLK